MSRIKIKKGAQKLFRQLNTYRVQYILIEASGVRYLANGDTGSDLTLWIGEEDENAWRLLSALGSALEKETKKGRPDLQQETVPSPLPDEISDLEGAILDLGTNLPRLKIHRKFEGRSFKRWRDEADILVLGSAAVPVLRLKRVKKRKGGRPPQLYTGARWTGWLRRAFRQFYYDHKFWYFCSCGFLIIGGAIYWMSTQDDKWTGFIVAGLHILVLCYIIDVAQVALLQRDPAGGKRATPFHIFIVAWLLPFALTAFPSIQHLNTMNYYRLLKDPHKLEIGFFEVPPLPSTESAQGEQSDPPDHGISLSETYTADNRDEAAEPAPSPPPVAGLGSSAAAASIGEEIADRPPAARSRSLDETNLKEPEIKRGFISVLLHIVIFSSLVVLVPLEFFALFFLKKDKKLYRRHILIAAGCLDVTTLFFLLTLGTQVRFINISNTPDRELLIGYLVALLAASFISSFQAIYFAQYQDDATDSMSDLVI